MKSKANNIQGSKDNWKVQETRYDPEDQHHLETIFTSGNGLLSTRGTFEERFPADIQATLIHGMWDDIPIAFSELVNSPDWTKIEIWIDGERFQMNQGEICKYSRFLDLKTGILHRTLHWTPLGSKKNVLISFERFASLDDPNILAVQVQVSPVNFPVEIRLRASLDCHIDNNGVLHWDITHESSSPQQASIVMKTRSTDKILGMRTHLSSNNKKCIFSKCDCPGSPGIEILVNQDVGDTLVVHKFIGFSTSRDSKKPIEIAQKKAILATNLGYETIKTANNKAWGDFWEKSDVVIDGDDEAQLSIRHALFQLRIAAPSKDQFVSIGAKTLSGFGYRGHVFWDTEIFILPFFTLTQPKISRNLLKYRFNTLEGARKKAKENGFSGAQFAWESAETGDEVTPRWVPDFHNPLQLIRIWTGDIEIHISSDIAYALYQYWTYTADDKFWVKFGIPILLETAIFLGERVETEGEFFSIRDIIGPDEYHEHVDNNAYTNCMVKWHLKTAINTMKWLSDHFPITANKYKENYRITSDRLNYWSLVADKLMILSDPISGLIEQFEGFFNLLEINLDDFEGRTKSMQEILGIDATNNYQVIKQADVIMLLCLFRNDYDAKTWKTNWDYYNSRTDHKYGSSLGPSFQAWAACEMDQPDLAYEHFLRAARSDLHNIRGNVKDGIHAASAGGLWQAIVFGFAGLNFAENKPTITPRLPSHWNRLSFKITYHNTQYQINISPLKSTITKLD